MSHRKRLHVCLVTGALAALVMASVPGAWTSAAQTNALTERPPLEWATAATSNEIAIVRHNGSCIRYHERFVDSKGDETRDVIESKDGAVARLIERNGRPLTPEQDASERERLNSLIDHPSEFYHHIKSYVDSKDIAVNMLQLMPTAMLYTYAEGQPQTPESAATQVVLDFAPNPVFHPPTTLSAALQGIKGRIWLDAKTKEVVRLEATIFQSINFGLAMLAHIYPGGVVVLQQAPAVGSRWNLTHFNEQVDMRFLMFKDIKVHTEVRASQFESISNTMSYQEAIHLLLQTPLPKSLEPMPSPGRTP